MTEILREIGNGISTRPWPDSNQFPCKHNSHVTRAHALLTKSTENVEVFNSTWSGYVILFFNIYLLIFNIEKSLHIVLRIAKQSDLIVVVVLQTNFILSQTVISFWNLWNASEKTSVLSIFCSLFRTENEWGLSSSLFSYVLYKLFFSLWLLDQINLFKICIYVLN